MEFFLNTLWLVLASAGVFALFRRRRSGCDRRRLLLGLGALLCAAALLFPAISITDDLHFDAFVVEDSNSTKRLVNAIAHVAPIAELTWFGFMAFAFLAVLGQHGWRAIDIVSSSYQNPFLIRLVLGRAPPADALA